MKTSHGCKPNVAAFHIENETCLEEVAACELFKHCVVVLGIVTSDVPDLIKNIFSYAAQKVLSHLPWAQSGGDCKPCTALDPGAPHCVPYSFERI